MTLGVKNQNITWTEMTICIPDQMDQFAATVPLDQIYTKRVHFNCQNDKTPLLRLKMTFSMLLLIVFKVRKAMFVSIASDYSEFITNINRLFTSRY